jgi:hypothetical protein
LLVGAKAGVVVVVVMFHGTPPGWVPVIAGTKTARWGAGRMGLLAA